MDKKIWVALAILVVLAIGAWLATSNKSDNNKSSDQGIVLPKQNAIESSSSDSSANTSTTETTKVEISNFAFSPSTITVKVGDTVTWENMDSSAHTVTGNSSNGPNSGTLQKGQSYSFKFTTAGTYKYICKFHTSMTGTVVVQ